jgi:hypothetical protein
MTINSNSPPPLGTEYYYPAHDALKNMPHLSEQEKAQLLLLEILDGCPNYVYDKVLSHIESNLRSVYTVGVKLYRREPLLSRLSKNFPIPPPQDVIVPDKICTALRSYRCIVCFSVSPLSLPLTDSSNSEKNVHIWSWFFPLLCSHS